MLTCPRKTENSIPAESLVTSGRLSAAPSIVFGRTQYETLGDAFTGFWRKIIIQGYLWPGQQPGGCQVHWSQLAGMTLKLFVAVCMEVMNPATSVGFSIWLLEIPSRLAAGETGARSRSRLTSSPPPRLNGFLL